MQRVVRVLFVAAALAGGCKGSTGYLGPGERCMSSTQCEPGLLCDLGQDPPVCSMDLTEPPDAAIPPPDAAGPVIDAGPMIDSAPGTPDAAPADARPPDAAPLPVDAAPPDARPPDAAPPDAAPPDAMV